MHANCKGALAQINKSWRAFTHNGHSMSKAEVKAVLEYAVEQKYETTKDIPKNEIDAILNQFKKLNQ